MDTRNIVFTTHNQVEAAVMQSILESNGIEVFTYRESISNMYGFYSPTLGGVELGVPAEQVERALEIIGSYQEEDGEGREDDRGEDAEA